MAALALAVLLAVPRIAAANTGAHPWVNPNAENKVVVFGDSLGDGVWTGLYRVLQKEHKDFAVIRKSRVATGLSRYDLFNWQHELENITASMDIDIAVIVFGTNDRQSIVEGTDYFYLRTEEWREAYAARVDAFTRHLQDRGAKVYWVGMPVMRSETFGNDMAYFNEIYRERAAANGATFIDTWSITADPAGNYRAYAEVDGRTKRLRADDGIHMTMPGYIMMAEAVADAIRRDSRDVPPAAGTVASAADEAPGQVQSGAAGEVGSGSAPADGPAVAEDQAPHQPAPSRQENVRRGPVSHAALSPQVSKAAVSRQEEAAPGRPQVIQAIFDMVNLELLTPAGRSGSKPSLVQAAPSLDAGAETDGAHSDRAGLRGSIVERRQSVPDTKRGRGDDFAWPRF